MLEVVEKLKDLNSGGGNGGQGTPNCIWYSRKSSYKWWWILELEEYNGSHVRPGNPGGSGGGGPRIQTNSSISTRTTVSGNPPGYGSSEQINLVVQVVTL